MGCNKSQHQFIHTCAFVMWVACVVAISTFFVCFFAKTAVVKLVSMQSQHCDADAFNKNTKKKCKNEIKYSTCMVMFSFCINSILLSVIVRSLLISIFSMDFPCFNETLDVICTNTIKLRYLNAKFTFGKFHVTWFYLFFDAHSDSHQYPVNSSLYLTLQHFLYSNIFGFVYLPLLCFFVQKISNQFIAAMYWQL